MSSLRELTPAIRLNGGLNTYQQPTDIADNEWQNGQNCKTDGLIVKKRGGVTKYNVISNGGKVIGTYRGYGKDGTIYSFSQTARAVFAYNSSGVWVAGGSIINSANYISWETMNDNVILCYGGEPYKFPLATASAFQALSGTTTPPYGKYVKLHKGYLFIANTVTTPGTYPSRIYWSTLWDPTTWVATEWERIREDDGDVITGMSSMNDVLYIYKTRSIHAFSGLIFDSINGDQSLRVVSDKIGLIAPKTLVSVGDYDIFLSSDGIRLFDGSTSKIISEKVSDIIQAIPTARVADCCAGYDSKNKWYWFAYNDSTLYPASVNNACLIYDFVYNCWYKAVNIAASSFVMGDGPGDTNAFYFGSSYNGNIYQVETSNTYDAPMEKQIENMDVQSEWTATGTGGQNTVKQEGTHSYKLTSVVGAQSSAVKTVDHNLAVWGDNSASTTADFIKFWVNINDIANFDGLYLHFRAPDTSNRYYYTKDATGLSTGWNLISVAKSAFSTTGSPNWNNIDSILIGANANASGTVLVSFDDLRMVSAVNTAIDAYVDTKTFDLQRPEVVKRLKAVYPEVDKATDFNLTVTGYYDNASSNSTLFNAAVSTLVGQVMNLFIGRLAKNVYFRFRNATVSQPFNIIKFALAYMTKFLK